MDAARRPAPRAKVSTDVQIPRPMADAGRVPTLRPLLLTLAALALPIALPAPAVAHHVASARGYDDPYDDTFEDVPVDEEAAPPAPEAAPAPVLPVPPVAAIPDLADPIAPPAEVLPVGPPLVTTATVPGSVALMRTDGKAAIPRGAPARIRAVIAAANQIIGKPYKWGGGHAKLLDRSYDCSGAVSYALVRAGLLPGVQVSGALARWAVAGEGRWLTTYANRGHVYLEVAGLRLDTSAVGDRGGRDGVRWRPVIGARPRFHARHLLGL